MEWNGRRITAIVENALLEDRATRDATSYACIDPNQRAAGTIIAKQDCILAGVGCVSRILDVYAILDGAVSSHYEVTSHPEVFDGVRLHNRQTIAVVRHNARVVLMKSNPYCQNHAGDREAVALNKFAGGVHFCPDFDGRPDER